MFTIDEARNILRIDGTDNDGESLPLSQHCRTICIMPPGTGLQTGTIPPLP